MSAVEAPPLAKHPAKFSDSIVGQLDRLVRAEQRRLCRELWLLDPFAGVGRIHRLHREGKIATVGVELEPEWAACHSRTICADSLAWMRGADVSEEPRARLFDVIATSPTYGNRMADDHDARDGSTRHSYRHDLGRPLSTGSSGGMPWGPRYWSFHAEAYRLMFDVLAPGGLLLLNVSDFVRHKAIVPAAMWHRGALAGAGFVESSGEQPRLVETRRLRYGENHDARAVAELIIRARKPEREEAKQGPTWDPTDEFQTDPEEPAQ
jgi:hypothetical protein